MFDFSFVDEELNKLSETLLKRSEKVIVTPPGPWAEIDNGKRVLQFSSNNYLGLANHPDICSAASAAATKYGVGSSGSRLLSGTSILHAQLEDKVAKWQKSESCIFFGSGYLANIGLISSLASPEDLIFSDESNHASIVDGIRFSKANKVIYSHLNYEMLEEEIQKSLTQNFKKRFIISNSLFSMHGDIADLNKIAEIAKKYNCIPIIDEAHTIGVYGKDGSGVVVDLNLEERLPIRIGTCSKAIGVEGGFVVGPKNVIELLKTKARSYIFSTAPTVTSTAAIIKSIDLIIDSEWRRAKLWNHVKSLHEGLRRIAGLKVQPQITQHIIIKFNSIDLCLDFSNRLFEECHIWAPAIRPPSVKEPIIRLTPISTHSEEDIAFVVKAFRVLADDIKLLAKQL